MKTDKKQNYQSDYKNYNRQYCYVCNNRGFFVVKEFIGGKYNDENNEPSYYEFVYYCPFCENGKQYNYDERSKIPYGYYIPPITDIYDNEVIDDIMKKNIASHKYNSNIELGDAYDE